MNEIVSQVLETKKTGSVKLRNDLLNNLKEKAFQVARKHCGKFGRRPTDEEYSVALNALNLAIDQFDLEKGSKFETFANRIITLKLLKLIDFFRDNKEEKEYVSFESDKITLISDLKLGSEFKNKEIQNELAEQRREELLRFLKMIGDLGYTWVDIMNNRPKHRDSIELVRNIALYIVRLGLGERFLQENPCSRKLKKEIGDSVKRRTLTKYRPYLCAIIIVLINDFPVLRNHLDFFKREEVNDDGTYSGENI